MNYHKVPDFVAFEHSMDAKSWWNFVFKLGKNFFFRERFIDSTDDYDKLAVHL